MKRVPVLCPAGNIIPCSVSFVKKNMSKYLYQFDVTKLAVSDSKKTVSIFIVPEMLLQSLCNQLTIKFSEEGGVLMSKKSSKTVKLDILNKSRAIGRKEAVLNGTWSKRPAVFRSKTASGARAKALDKEIREYL